MEAQATQYRPGTTQPTGAERSDVQSKWGTTGEIQA